MNKDKMYFLGNKIEGILWLVAPILALIGARWNPLALQLSAHIFILLGIFLFIKYAYFKKAQIIFTDRGTGLLALLWTITEGTVVIAIGIYILAHL